MSDPWPPKPPEAPVAEAPVAEAPVTEAPVAPDPGPALYDGRPSPNRRALAIAVVAVLGFMAIAALVGGGAKPPGAATFPPVGATTGPAGGVAAATRTDVARALSAQGLQLDDSARPYRPAEAPAFATAPRVVLRAVLPDDPDHGLIVVYEFSSPVAATAAAGEQAAYVASGVGRVQFPPDSRFVIRVVGATAIFFTWSPASSPDARTAFIGDALDKLGLEVAVPN